MNWLGDQEDTIFLGQAVGVPGTGMYNTLKDISIDKRIELPVFEETQMGMSIGLSITNKVPVSIYPRWNFLLCAVNQLVTHLDAMPDFSHGEYLPKVIIRTSIGSERPLHPQAQHVGDYSEAFKKMLKRTDVVVLDDSDQIVDAYKKAYRSDHSTILVEYGDYYNEK